MSPHAEFSNPQSINLYSYVGNNPLTHNDPTGHCCWENIVDAVNFAVGFANAWDSNNLAGAGRTEQFTSAGKLGQAAEHATAMVTGTIEVLAGAGGEGIGGGLDATGVGAPVGIALNVVSAVAIAHGGATAGEGAINLGGDIHNAMGPKQGESGGPGAGKDFSNKTKDQAVQENKSANGGTAKCVFCGENVGAGTDNKTNIDHAQAKVNGGTNSLKQRECYMRTLQ